MAAQLLHHFTPSEQINPSFLHHFTPLPAQLLHLFIPSEEITPSFLHLFTTLDCPTITSFYPLLNKLTPHSYTNLPSLAAQLFYHFTPSGQITPSLLHQFTLLGSPTLTSFYTPPPPNKLPPHSYTNLTPLAAQLLHHFTPSEEITPSFLHLFTTLDCPTITSFYPLLNKLLSHSYTNLPSLADQLLHHFSPSGQITPSLLHQFNLLGSPTLTSFYPLWTNYPLTFTPIYPPW